MRDWDNDANRSRHRANAGKRALVVRNVEDDSQLDEMLERLERLENASEQSKKMTKNGEGRVMRFDLRTLVALIAILLSITGYVIEDARNTSRQDAEIEATQVRVSNLEKIASQNTEARIRTEVQLGELREGQNEIKQMLRAHDDQTARILRKK
jgi:predicted nuclease with TOPRIM domain